MDLLIHQIFLLFYDVFEIGSHSVASAGLELTM